MDSAMDNCAHSGILTSSSLIIVRRKEWPKPDKCREIQASKQTNLRNSLGTSSGQPCGTVLVLRSLINPHSPLGPEVRGIPLLSFRRTRQGRRRWNKQQTITQRWFKKKMPVLRGEPHCRDKATGLSGGRPQTRGHSRTLGTPRRKGLPWNDFRLCKNPLRVG